MGTPAEPGVDVDLDVAVADDRRPVGRGDLDSRGHGAVVVDVLEQDVTPLDQTPGVVGRTLREGLVGPVIAEFEPLRRPVVEVRTVVFRHVDLDEAVLEVGAGAAEFGLRGAVVPERAPFHLDVPAGRLRVETVVAELREQAVDHLECAVDTGAGTDADPAREVVEVVRGIATVGRVDVLQPDDGVRGHVAHVDRVAGRPAAADEVDVPDHAPGPDTVQLEVTGRVLASTVVDVDPVV